MLFLLILQIFAQYRIIHGNQTMSSFKFLCGPNYGHVPHNLNLLSLIVFTRNGDRSPEKGKNKAWRHNMCVRCSGNNCHLIQCRNGLLTIKGYNQGHDLAGFIKKEYYPLFYNKNTRQHPIYDYGTKNKTTADVTIHGYSYESSKNRVFLKSILSALEYGSLKVKNIKDLDCPTECLDLRNSLFSKNDSEKLIFGGEFDRIIASLCNKVPLECGKFGCDLLEMENFLSQEKMNFEDNLVKMEEDIVPTAVSFGPLSEFILSILPNRDLTIVSVTAETIITLLAGFNTDNSKLVPYAGSIFIELWQNDKKEEFYSIVYNGKRQKIGLFRETFVEKSEFVKFLKMFNNHIKEVKKVCGIKKKGMKNEDLLNVKKRKIREVFEPLIKKLHDKRVLVK